MPMQLIRALAALLVVLATPAWAGSIALTGTVTYRERMALPPDAWLRVTLVELEGAVPVAGATASIPARGQVPLAFTLNVHSHVDALAGNHGLIAEISSAGRILFRNPIPAPVSASAQPVQITVNFSPQAVEPPAPQPPAPAILDTIWTVTSIGGHPVTGQRPLTLSIAADHRAGGSGGCNNFFTEASLDQETIAFGPAAATRMACDPAIMDQEAAYFAALAAVTAYEYDAQSLRLLDAAGIPLIGLVRATE